MKKKKELVILHFAPLELYPPIINLGEYLGKFCNLNTNITILTTYPELITNLIEFENINILRFKGIEPNNSKFKKAARYFKIYFFMFAYLIKIQPNIVFYFETLSSLPVLLYKKFLKNVPVFIHYHELVTKEELMDGRLLNKYLNKAEEKLYLNASWISHTNKHRLDLFHKEFPHLDGSVLKALPNYPSSSWLKAPKQTINTNQEKITKLIHIGALSIKGLYLKEVLEHFGNKVDYTIDFYSHNFNPEVKALLKQYNNCYIKGALAYTDMHQLKGIYNVGLVLYKGLSLNFTYNAPNKIFEYLALDLDVLCSDKLITARDYVRSDCFPKMIMVDFEKLEEFDIDKALEKKGVTYVQSPYVCEPIYEILLNTINENINSKLLFRR